LLGVGIALGAVVAIPRACAQETQALKLSPLLEARLREEHVDQTGIADNADALTLRVRAGVLATRGRLNALVEAEGTLAIVDDYYDGLHGPPTRPLVPDPQDVAIYRAQIQYKDKHVALTLGRQRISLDDDRFVDAALFRQNGQSFDAVRLEWTGVQGLRADLTYAWNLRTIWGVDGEGARPASTPGTNLFGEVGYTTPLGTITAFGYLVSQDDASFQGFRLSSQTWGARLSGSQPIASGTKLSYRLSYARQSDWRRNPNNYSADFYLADIGLDVAHFRVGGGYEVVGASKGAPFTSFQFPVGSGIRYRGWASKFNPTPPDGVRDLYGSIGYSLPRLGPFKAFGVQAFYHRFDSDRLVRHYGDELDALVGGKLGHYALSLRLADYYADHFATRTRKAWVQLDWTF